MDTSQTSLAELVKATGVRFDGDRLFVSLSDEREVSVLLGRVKWLRWLRDATPRERAAWTIEPGGFAVYWEGLDDGFEISHLLAMHPLA